MLRCLFRYTGTLGVRENLSPRYTLRRSFLTVETEAGPGARVGWLDLATLEDRAGAFLLKGDALALADEGGRLVLYRAALQDTDSRGFYAIDFIAPLGELMERDGALFLEIE